MELVKEQELDAGQMEDEYPDEYISPETLQALTKQLQELMTVIDQAIALMAPTEATSRPDERHRVEEAEKLCKWKRGDDFVDPTLEEVGEALEGIIEEKTKHIRKLAELLPVIRETIRTSVERAPAEPEFDMRRNSSSPLASSDISSEKRPPRPPSNLRIDTLGRRIAAKAMEIELIQSPMSSPRTLSQVLPRGNSKEETSSRDRAFSMSSDRCPSPASIFSQSSTTSTQNPNTRNIPSIKDFEFVKPIRYV